MVNHKIPVIVCAQLTYEIGHFLHATPCSFHSPAGISPHEAVGRANWFPHYVSSHRHELFRHQHRTAYRVARRRVWHRSQFGLCPDHYFHG